MLGRSLLTTHLLLKTTNQQCRTLSGLLHHNGRALNSYLSTSWISNSSLNSCRSCTLVKNNNDIKLNSYNKSTYFQCRQFSISTKHHKSFKDHVGKMYSYRDNVKFRKDSLFQKYTAARFVNAAPESWKPYLQLARVDKPIGSWLLYLPCAFSITLATPLGSLPNLYYLGLFGVGAFLMRGAGCVINDLWDRDFDKHVERTKNRPLASGRLKPRNAIALLAVQLSLSLGILSTLNTTCIMIGVASMIPVILYPLAKRYTHFPQAVLGLTFNIGAIMGYAAVAGSINWAIVGPLYLGCFFWTIYYDTIYALQDVDDDVLIGVKSTATLFSRPDAELMKLPLAERMEIMEKQRKKVDNFLLAFHTLALGSWVYSFAAASVVACIIPTLQIIKITSSRYGEGGQSRIHESLWDQFVACKKTGLYILFGLIGGMYFGYPSLIVDNKKS